MIAEDAPQAPVTRKGRVRVEMDNTEILDVYDEWSRGRPRLGGPPLPGVAVHLAACGPCDEDFQGLLAAAGATP